MNLTQELYAIIMRDIRHANPRLRLAVTPEEYEKIKAEIFEGSTIFNARIANLPLVVEADADRPLLSVEFKPDVD